MQVPNSLIYLRNHNGTGAGPLMYPEYVANILRAVHTGRLDAQTAGQGIEIVAYPEDGDPGTRYREVFSVEQEMAWLRKMYGGNGGKAYVDHVWTVETLKAEMTKLMKKEAERLRNLAKPRAAITPHASFVTFGVPDDLARALQAAGYADRASCVGKDLYDLVSVNGIGIELAEKLITPDKAEAKK